MGFTIVLEPVGQQGEDGVCVGQDVGRSIVAFEGFDEGLGHAVALRATDWGKEQGQPKGSGGLSRLAGDIGTAIIGEPFHPVARSGAPEAALDRCDHQVAHHLGGDTGIGNGEPNNDFAVAGIDDKENPDHLAIAGTDLQMVRAPAYVGAQGHHDAVMSSPGTLSRVALQGQVMLAHDAQHPLGVDDRLALEPAFPVDQRGDPAIAIGWTLVDDRPDLGQQLGVPRLAIGATRDHDVRSPLGASTYDDFRATG